MQWKKESKMLPNAHPIMKTTNPPLYVIFLLGSFLKIYEVSANVMQRIPIQIPTTFDADIHQNRPDSPEYDVTSVWIPTEKLMRQEPKHSTPAMLQYWNLKKEHFDKIVFFKVASGNIMDCYR
jgi:hypothetical protein